MGDSAESTAGIISVDDVVGLIPGAAYASVTLVEKQQTVTTLAWTHYYPVCVDGIQQIHLQGPCLRPGGNRPVVVDDLTADSRWPTFRHAVLTRTPVRSMLSFEVWSTGDSAAMLNVYAAQSHAFAYESVALGMVCAAHVSGGQDVTGDEDTAVAMLMEQFRIKADAAMRLLERMTRDRIPVHPITLPSWRRLSG